jgi:hypothetical protein
MSQKSFIQLCFTFTKPCRITVWKSFRIDVGGKIHSAHLASTSDDPWIFYTEMTVYEFAGMYRTCNELENK